MLVDSFCHHLAHPFSLERKNIKLQGWERRFAVAALACTIFGLLPGLVAFYTLTYFFKKRHVTKLEADPHASINKVSQENFKETRSISTSLSKSCSLLTSDTIIISSPAQSEPDVPKPDTLLKIDSSQPSQEPIKPDALIASVPSQQKRNLSKINLPDSLEQSILADEIDKKLLKALAKTHNELFIEFFVKAVVMHKKGLIRSCLDYVKYEIEGILDRNQLFDCEIKVGDSVLKMNKAILSAMSPFFESLFRSTMLEAQTGVVTIHDTSFICFSKAIKCILFGHYSLLGDVDGENIEEFLNIAQCYEFERVKQYCEDWIIKNFSQLDKKQVFNLAQDYCLDKVKSFLFKQILKKKSLVKNVDRQKFDLFLKEITELDLSNEYGDVQGKYPEQKILFNLCPNLRVLNLSNCTWIDQGFLTTIKDLTKLEDLNLLACAIDDITSLNKLTKLRKLNLSNISDLSVIEQFQELEELTLHYTVQIKNLSIAKPLKNLKYFSLRSYAGDFSFLNKLPSLEILKLSRTQLVNQSLDFISRISNLHTLDIGDSDLGDLSSLKELKKLKNLTLKHNKQLTDISFLRGVTHLKELCLEGCTSIVDFSPLESLSELETLDLKNSKLSNVEFLYKLNRIFSLRLPYIHDLKPIAYLKDLGLLEINYFPKGSCPSQGMDLTPLSELQNLGVLKISDLPFEDISPLSRLTNLYHLELIRCKFIKNAEALKPLSKLETLILNELDLVQDLSCLSSHPSLRILDLRGCSGIQDFSFLEDTNKLVFISLAGCQFMDVSKLKFLQKRCILDINERYVNDLVALNTLVSQTRAV